MFDSQFQLLRVVSVPNVKLPSWAPRCNLVEVYMAGCGTKYSTRWILWSGEISQRPCWMTLMSADWSVPCQLVLTLFVVIGRDRLDLTCLSSVMTR